MKDLIEEAVKHLKEVDEDGSLINFWDDTANWKKIVEETLIAVLTDVEHKFTHVKNDVDMCICGEAFTSNLHV